jgi:hypothetical protein
MPKITVAKDHHPHLAEDEIRPSWEVIDIFPEPAAGSPKRAAEK